MNHPDPVFLVKPFITHHKGEHCVGLFHGKMWLFWRHPDGQWGGKLPALFRELDTRARAQVGDAPWYVLPSGAFVKLVPKEHAFDIQHCQGCALQSGRETTAILQRQRAEASP